jgi:hypothetical protein
VTHRILSVLTFFFVSACALGASAEGEPPDVSAHAAPAQEAPARVDRVVVVPLNLVVRAPAELEGEGDPVWQELLRYFQERDRKVGVLNEISAERLWLQAIRDLDLTDRSAALREGEARFARELAKHKEYDMLVIPSLVLRPGHLSGYHAVWDGVQREVPNAAILIGELNGGIDASADMRFDGLRGKVGAVSLHVTVLRSDGSEVFQGLGGLDVLQKLAREHPWDGSVRFVKREEFLDDPEAIREGIERAFDGPTLTAARAR